MLNRITRSGNIQSTHFQEWVKGSGVSKDIVQLNLVSVSGEEVFDLLYPEPKRLNGGRLNSSYLNKFETCKDSSGWWVENLDPLTGELTGWGQFKADKGTSLSAVKYRSPQGLHCEPICLQVPSSFTKSMAEKARLNHDGEDFWEFVLNNKSLPLIITEGAKKAGSILSQGLPAVGLSGIFNAYLDKELHPVLRKMCEGREVYILFDSDPLIKAQLAVKQARQKLGFEISVIASDLKMAYVPAVVGKKQGVDDFLVAGGKLTNLVKNAVPFKDWLNPRKSKNWKAQLSDMKETLGGRLRFNELSSEFEFDGIPVDWDVFCQRYAMDVEDHSYGVDRFTQLAIAIGKEYTYNPIKDYFESLPQQSNYDLDDVGVKYFGVKPGSIESKFVRKWLISAVARTYNPGCKVDSALILYDPKGGLGKSTWFRRICPVSKYFCDDMGDISDKDEKLKMHQNFIIEWAELDGIFGFKHSSAIKSFIATGTDNIRLPYGRCTKRMPRRSILCGSTNKKEILMDDGGNRRYWPIAIATPIDNELLLKEKDSIWASAKQAYFSGEKWYLSLEDQRQADSVVEDFTSRAQGWDEIEDFVASLNRDEFTVTELRHHFDIPVFDTKFTGRAKRILEKMGWQSTRTIKTELGYQRGYRKIDTINKNDTINEDILERDKPCQPPSTQELQDSIDMVDTVSYKEKTVINKERVIDSNISISSEPSVNRVNNLQDPDAEGDCHGFGDRGNARQLSSSVSNNQKHLFKVGDRVWAKTRKSEGVVNEVEDGLLFVNLQAGEAVWLYTDQVKPMG